MGTIVVTGGAGFIGSHTLVALHRAGHRAIVVDDLSNSSRRAIERVGEITGVEPELIVADAADREALDRVFEAEPVEAVIHFAGLKAVGESVAEPLRYFRTNLGTTMTLLEAMADHEVFDLIFSSSATVYGHPEQRALTESDPLGAANPYGRTKLTVEDLCRSLADVDPRWTIALLRYFNPVGAHPSGLIGEDPAGIPNNLMPYLMQVAIGRLEQLTVFGDDYDTRDGTCIRDYIHVMDLAEGHVAALDARPQLGPGAHALNLGTGRGTTVLEMLAAAEAAVGAPIPHRIGERRPGDAPVAYADPSRAAELLGWSASRSVEDMCRDHWRWQQRNPHGYRDAPG